MGKALKAYIIGYEATLMQSRLHSLLNAPLNSDADILTISHPTILYQLLTYVKKYYRADKLIYITASSLRINNQEFSIK